MQPEKKAMDLIPIKEDDGVFRVPEETLIAYRGKEITFEYRGDTMPIIFMPVRNVFACRVIDFEKVDKQIWHARLRVRVDAPLMEFNYGIYISQEDEFVEAASPPRIIITDPPKGDDP